MDTDARGSDPNLLLGRAASQSRRRPGACREPHKHLEARGAVSSQKRSGERWGAAAIRRLARGDPRRPQTHAALRCGCAGWLCGDGVGGLRTCGGQSPRREGTRVLRLNPRQYPSDESPTQGYPKPLQACRANVSVQADRLRPARRDRSDPRPVDPHPCTRSRVRLVSPS